MHGVFGGPRGCTLRHFFNNGTNDSPSDMVHGSTAKKESGLPGAVDKTEKDASEHKPCHVWS